MFLAEFAEAAKRIYERKNELIRRADNLVVMRADGEISPNEFKKNKSSIEQELNQIDREGGFGERQSYALG